jgi:hypothetical protein
VPRPLLLLEELDARILPSVPPPFPQGVFPYLIGLVQYRSQPLHGTGDGNYMGHSLIVDAGLYDKLSGTARLTGLGSFQVDGWLQGVGLVVSGRAKGELGFSTSRGTLTLTLHGPTERSFGVLPSKFRYSISHAAGDYQKLHGSGVVQIRLIPAPVAFGLPPQGRFELSFA